VDAWLAKELQKRNKPVIFVRTKIGIDVENFKHDHPEMDGETVQKEALAAMKKDMLDNTVKFQNKLGVFLIDNHHFDNYEFSDLEEQMTEKLSTVKKQALVRSLSRMSRDILERKVAELKTQIVPAALATAALGTIPEMSFITDEIIVRYYASSYIDQLGLDTESRGNRSIDPVNLNVLESRVKWVMADIPNVIEKTGLYGSNISKHINVLLRALPVVNSCISAYTVAKSLEEILGRFEAISWEAIDALQQMNERDWSLQSMHRHYCV